MLKEGDDEAKKSDEDDLVGTIEKLDLVGIGAEDDEELDTDAVIEDVFPGKAGLPSTALLSVSNNRSSPMR